MQSIPVKRSKKDLLHQFHSIKQVENFKYKQAYGKPLIIQLSLTVLIFSLFTLTTADAFVKLKGVVFFLLLLSWVVCSCFLAWHIIQRQRHNASVRKRVESEIASNKEYFMSFTEHSLIHGSSDYHSELQWNYFVGYLESSDAIFLFHEGSIYSCIAFSQFEIGLSNLNSLKSIVREKVPVLDKSLCLK